MEAMRNKLKGHNQALLVDVCYVNTTDGYLTVE